MLVALELEPLRVAQQRAGLHAQQRVVGLVVVAVGVVAVVGGEQRRADRSWRSRCSLGLVSCCAGEAVVLDLDEQVVLAEDVLQAGRLVEGALLVALQQRLQHVPAEAAGGGDQAVGGTSRAAPSRSGACSSSPP